MLHLTAALDQKLRNAVDDFDFNTYVRALTDFCNEDLSAFYFDIRKDSLYCDAPSSLKRRAYRTVLDTLFQALVRWLAPVLVFTTEEVWATRYPDEGSVHLLEWPAVLPVDVDEGKWAAIRKVRTACNQVTEQLRTQKVIGSGLEADVLLGTEDESLSRTLSHVDLTELCITAKTELRLTEQQIEGGLPVYPGFPSKVSTGHPTAFLYEARRTQNHKCGRCWRLLPEVTSDGDLCNRCDEVVNG
jgi:isoleucyl-tRNA synthetase